MPTRPKTSASLSEWASAWARSWPTARTSTGKGWNLAARLESLAEPGGICISDDVYRQVRNKLSVNFEYLGENRLKNIAEDVAAYRVSFGEKRRFKAFGARRARPSRTPKRAIPAPGDRQERVIRHAKILGAIWAVLFLIDIGTGAPFWAHWPGIPMAALLGLEAVPLFVRGWFKILNACGAVIVGALALINLFSWSGYAWVLWPASLLIIIEMVRRSSFRYR